MEIFANPLIIPLGAFAVAIVAIVSGVFSQMHSSRVKADQRMAMLARGMSIEDIERLLGKRDEPETRAPKDPLRSLGIARRTGIILVSSGLGIIFFFFALTVVIRDREILSGAACGLVPLTIGVGFFIDYYLQRRELSRFGLEIEPSVREKSRR